MAKGVYLPSELYKSKAFISLGGAAPQVLLLMMDKRKMETSHVKVHGKKQKVIECTNAEKLKLSYYEAKREYGITFLRFKRAIDELIEKGFIKVTHRGGGCQKDISTYALSDEYRFWQLGKVIGKRKIDPVPRGFCKPNTPKKISRDPQEQNSQHTQT